MIVIDEIMRLDFQKYPLMKKKDVQEFDEIFNKIVFGDSERYPPGEYLDFGAGIILKRMKKLLENAAEIEQQQRS